MLIDDDSNGGFSSGQPTNPEKRKEHSRGLSPLQRFIVTLVIFFMVAAVGLFILIMFQKILLPQ